MSRHVADEPQSGKKGCDSCRIGVRAARMDDRGHAMALSTTVHQAPPGPRDIRRMLKTRVLTAVHVVLEEELEAILGSGWFERTRTPAASVTAVSGA